jgi:hypothetical protein
VYVLTDEQPFARAIGSLEMIVSVWKPAQIPIMHPHDLPNISNQRTGLANIDRFVEAFPRGSNKPLRFFVYSTHRVCFIQIAVEAWYLQY